MGMGMSTRSAGLSALSAGAIAGAILLVVGALQAAAVGADQRHGQVGLALTLLRWPALSE
jgi:hypothetical protein